MIINEEFNNEDFADNFEILIEKICLQSSTLELSKKVRIQAINNEISILRSLLDMNLHQKLKSAAEKLSKSGLKEIGEPILSSIKIFKSSNIKEGFKEIFRSNIQEKMKNLKEIMKNLKKELKLESLKKPPKNQNLTFFSAQKDNEGFAIPFTPTHKRKIKSESEGGKPVKKLPPVKKNKTVENEENEKPKRALNARVKKVEKAENEEKNNGYQSN